MKVVSDQYVFYGNGKDYTNPAKFKYNEVLHSTNIYKKAIKAKDRNLLGEYYKYVDQMTERMKVAINEFGIKSNYDLIVNCPMDNAVDITEEIRKTFKDDIN